MSWQGAFFNAALPCSPARRGLLVLITDYLEAMEAAHASGRGLRAARGE